MGYARPRKQPLRRVSVHVQEKMYRQVQQMLEKGGSFFSEITNLFFSVPNGVPAMDTDMADSDLEMICSDLDIPDDIQQRACNMLNLLKSKEDILKIPKMEILACAVYIAVVDARMPYGPFDPQLQCGYLEQPAVTVTDILVNAQVSVQTLFRRMHQIRDVVGLSEAVKYHLKFLEKKYCIVSALSHRFNRLCENVFNEDQKEETIAIPIPLREGVEIRKRLCWTLFVHAKSALLTDEQIVDAFYILVCCLEYILRTVPAFQLNPPFDAVVMNYIDNSKVPGASTNMLQKLAEELKLCYEEVQSVQVNRTEPFIQSLPHTDGELDIKKLTESYEKLYHQEGDINELRFLDNDPHLVALEQHGEKSSPSKENHADPPMTPIRAALNTVQQLKNILSSSQDEPSAKLQEFYEKCSGQNPAKDIADRVVQMEEVFIKRFVNLTSSNQQSVAEQRFTLAKCLYYRVLEAMLQTEKERLSKTDFSTLLKIETLHKSLVACSVEIVLMTYGVSWNPVIKALAAGDSKFAFPWILEVFEIHPYDFYKVLDSFIKAEPILTKEIVKHLQSIEIKILESFAWEEGSPLFHLLYDSIPASPPDASSHEITPSSADLYLSPMRPPLRTKAVSTAGAVLRTTPVTTPQDSPDKPPPRRSQSLQIFLNKVSRLGFHRLQQLCNLLNVPRDLQRKIWACFEYCITRKPDLLKNRHLDQIMLCSLYGICKVVEQEIKFKSIVQTYKDLPHSQQHVYKSALIEGDKSDSIIGFYNKVFMHNMKSFILQFVSRQAVSGNTPQLSPVVGSSPLNSPIYVVSSRRGFYVSPLRDSPFKPPPSPSQLTPRSRQLYNFGERIGSSEKLQRINETMVRARSGSVTPRSQKRLMFDQMDEPDAQSMALPDDCAVIKKKKVSIQGTEITTMKHQPKYIRNDSVLCTSHKSLVNISKINNLPGHCKIGEHVIKLTTDEPVRSKPYPVPHAMRETVNTEVKTMLEMVPDCQKTFILRTDASNVGLGAVLLQEWETDSYPIAYAPSILVRTDVRVTDGSPAAGVYEQSQAAELKDHEMDFAMTGLPIQD
ncbi:retinoblastoma-associated protein-like [Ylistrum balloti]|uniref:retinoblastoma-associated protein-like n=1 Tax=Ylistrum balloti TaxID=509963 RepID=UPI002905DBC5|nr:retinoblastoma-associated protein-like [Ylistrum balloti]